MITTEERQAPLSLATGDGLFHVACCQDGDVALCGIDISQHEWDENSLDPACQPCDELDAFDCDQGCPVQALLDLKASTS